MDGLCEVCRKKPYARISSGIRLCEMCFGQVVRLKEGGERERIYFSDPSKLMYSSESAKRHIRGLIEENFKDKADEIVINNEVIKREPTDPRNFIKNVEYEVVTIPHKNGTSVNDTALSATLTAHAKNGWKLHTMERNLLKGGIDSEIVLVFER